MFRIERGPLLIQTLAVCLAVRAFAETEFVTDRGGAQLAEIFGWKFSRVVTPLDEFPSDGLDHIWALGKLVACSIQDEPFVQFDGDVLLFKPLPKRLTRHRLIAQSPDFPHYYASREMRAAQDIAGFAPGGAAYNAGLLGGSDVALVRAYAWAGLDLAQKFRGCPLNGTTTSMVIEQYQLGVFARRVSVEVGTLLPLAASRKQVTEAGYAHLTGSAKRNPIYVAKAEARLAAQFPEAYERFLAGWSVLARDAAPAGTPQDCSAAAMTAAF
jgi:hypothetical protein